MKRNSRLVILCMALAACLLLSACGSQENYPTTPRADSGAQQPAQVQQEQPQVQAQSIIPQVDYDSGAYDPTQEEGGQEELIQAQANAPTPVLVMDSVYAGATPVIIDPVDKPTPTPLPNLKFSYSAYTASALHLTFEGPSGWIVDESAPDTYVLTNPDTSMDYAATVSIRVVPVNKQYSSSEITKEVKGALDTIHSDMNLKSFDPSNTATRTFIDGNGVYAAYRAYTQEGVGVAGRVIINCVNKNLYIMHASYPRSLADTFAEGVYNKIRSSMKITQ